MPDLLTHVLVGYSIGTLLSFRDERIRPAQVTLVMVGALSPDLRKIGLLIPDAFVARLVGVPFSWAPLHTLGGTLLVVLFGSLSVAPDYRRQAIALLALGAVSLDLLPRLKTRESHHGISGRVQRPCGFKTHTFQASTAEFQHWLGCLVARSNAPHPQPSHRRSGVLWNDSLH